MKSVSVKGGRKFPPPRGGSNVLGTRVIERFFQEECLLWKIKKKKETILTIKRGKKILPNTQPRKHYNILGVHQIQKENRILTNRGEFQVISLPIPPEKDCPCRQER